jgi:UDP-N-acetylmuramyl pentapeptide phosphotransferase/UDP-N-acetylglucosamine-1-phosphate transferase
MDGINGITGGYSFVLIATLIYINTSVFEFINAEFLYFVLISLVIFNFLNFRKIAICFAGDIGSISMGFIVIFLLSKLILESGDYDYILLLALYGIDSISTLIIRLFNKENIFTAHKKHLYQMLIYNSGWSHLKVSISYMIIQGVINFAILTRVQYFKEYHLFGLVILGFVGGAYLIIRSKASNA